MSTTKDRLIDVSGDLFYARGFQAVGLDQILEQVGITKTAFYKHFESKDELIIAVLARRDRQELDDWIKWIRIRGSDDARNQLQAFLELLDEWFSKPEFRGCLFMNALTEFPNENDPINRAARGHGEHLAAAIQELAAAAGARQPALLANQLMLLITGAISARHQAGDLGSARTASEMARVLIGAQCGSEKTARAVAGKKS
ncbi:MAG: TetR/AcrR family transcriptional regulator [Planctomycetes bacterium]|nr:TetR/AcrR family transcriptional regulator [Planctomycetota bacterium]